MMGGNLAMANHITNESEEHNMILADVNYYIEEKGLSYEEAMAKVQIERFEEEHSPKASDFI